MDCEKLQRVFDVGRDENEKTIIMVDWNASIGKGLSRGLGSMENKGKTYPTEMAQEY